VIWRECCSRLPLLAFDRSCVAQDFRDFGAVARESILDLDNAPVLQRAKTMTWKGLHPLVRWVTTTYEHGKRISMSAFAPLTQRLQRSSTLQRWSVLIEPLSSGLAPVG
jgi:hypothetical protein